VQQHSISISFRRVGKLEGSLMPVLIGLFLLALMSCTPPPVETSKPLPVVRSGQNAMPEPAATPRPVVAPRPELSGQCQPNGCGPAQFFAGDLLDNLAGCPFLDACNKHDTCYSSCASECQSTQQDGYCRKPVDARRAACDRAFRLDLNRLSSARLECQLAAEAYAQAVEAFGSNYFRAKLRRQGDASLTTADQRQIAADFERRLAALKRAQAAAR
jgi:hypothetical protein